MFVTDRARPILARPTLRFVTVRRFLFINPEPVRAFPSKLFAEGTAEIAQTIICRREPLTAARHAFLTRKMYIIILSICFDGACDGVIEAVVIGAKASHIKPPHIPFGMTINDPLCHRLADAARSRQARS